MSEPLDLVAGEEVAGTRIDRFVADVRPELSRTRAATLVAEGHVLVNGRAVVPSHRLSAGERVSGTIPEPPASTLSAEDVGFGIVFEDEDILVVDKPAGLVVHPGSGIAEGTLVHGLLRHVGESLRTVGGAARPGIVHRLDKGTSGVMVVAKTALAHASLVRQFARREVEKRYLAIVLGEPGEEGRSDEPIGRSPSNRTRRAVAAAGAIGARPASTAWRRLESFGGLAASLDVDLETGRTHQIRVHLAACGHPLVGDDDYGGRRARGVGDGAVRRLLTGFGRPALHARRLVLSHPTRGDRRAFEAPAPEDLQGLLSALRARFGGSAAR